MGTIKRIELPVFESILLFVLLVIIAGLYQITFDVFSPFRSLVSGFLAFLFIFALFRFQVSRKIGQLDWVLVAIIGISLLIRLNPWLYLEGGQDQGVYVAMSKQFELSERLNYKDNVIDNLTDELKDKYTKLLGWRALGFSRDNLTEEITTNFYPAHPISMSIFGYVFGDENRVASLTFFSIVSIIAVFLLTYELSGNKVAGYVAASLIGLSPLHIYFSKFPVTEIMTLALNLSTIYFLIKARKEGWKYLVMATITINVLLFTRLTWVVAIPVVLLAFVTLFSFDEDKKRKKEWAIFGVALLVQTLIAIAFYYIKIPFLYTHFFADIFKFIPKTIFYAMLVTSPFWIYFLTTNLKSFTQKTLLMVYKYRAWIFSLILLFLVYVTAKNFYQMVFTDKYIGGQYDKIWGMARGGWIVLKDMAFSSLVIYLTPFGILGLILSIKSVNTPQKALVMLFLLSYTVFHFYIVKFTPYHYYFARYQLSEIIPLIIIFVSIYTVNIFKNAKWISLLILVPMFLYSIVYVPFLFQGPVGTSSKIFKSIANVVREDDTIVFYNPQKWADNFIFSPLKYYFNFKAINADNFEDAVAYTSEIASQKSYLLSTVKIEDSRFKYIKTYRFTKGFYANAKEDHPPLTYEISNWQIPFCNKYLPEKFCGGVIPIQYHRASLDLYLYNYIEN